ncbi:MAG: hypothetical protein Fur0010_17010 [Bdellovibrio sp.]
MAQVILVEKDKTLRELLSINFSTYIGVEVIPRDSAQDVIALLAILPNVDLIVYHATDDDKDGPGILLKYIKENCPDSTILFTGFGIADENYSIVVHEFKNWEKIIQQASKILGISQEMMKKKVQPDYVPVPVTYFMALDTSCCDVFIRIKKSANDYQFIKRIHSGDTYSKAMIQRYIEQGLKHFYIANEMRENFTNFVSNFLVEQLESTYQGPIDKQIEHISKSYDVVTKEIVKLGFNTATIQLTESVLESMTKTIENSPEMGPLLRKVLNSKTGYMYQHCHMTSIVASEILSTLGVGSKENHLKMAFAGFFHDISFVNNEDLAKISSYEELERAELNEQDWDLVFNHALEASILVGRHPDVPKGVVEIIRNHHGAMNGKGFTITEPEKLSGMDKIFFIACEFVKQLLAYKENGGKPAPIIDSLFERFTDPEMVKVIKSLELTLKTKKKK